MVSVKNQMKRNGWFKRFWVRLFFQIGVIFAGFVLLLTLCNTAFLESYYKFARGRELRTVSTQITKVDLSDSSTMVDLIRNIQEDRGFEVEIFSATGYTLYSSGGQMLDYFFQNNLNLNMNHRPLKAIESREYSDGSVMEKAIDVGSGKEYLLYRFSLEKSFICEIRVQMAQIKGSAKIANTFISLIAGIFLILALVWVLWFARRIARPISKMNAITKNMAALDFTETLQAESVDEIGQLAASINELSSKLDTTLKDLQASNAQLRDEIEAEHQLDIMRRGFVANVSHELKTPIAIIQGYAEGLKLDINSDSREKYCDTIMDESHKMNRLVLSLLNLSKYESGQITLNRQSFDISELLYARAERIFSGDNVRVVYELPEKCFVFADPDQIEQVIKSYLENASSHVDSGGSITVSSAEVREGILRISISNTGATIPEEELPQIWQSFYRGDSSHNRESGRFGLGLSIVSAIMKLHGQSCGVYNQENGVCFWFELPIAL